VNCDEILLKFVGEVGALGSKLAVLLVQLPPKLDFQAAPVESFFERLSSLTPARLVCEPRHPSWFEDEADERLRSLAVARIAADPALTPRAARPGGWRGLSYWRLHGSPAMYRSAYGEDRLAAYAALIREERQAGHAVWCMFDNTAASAATGDAIALSARLAVAGSPF
jgi:uncharacterized protein YecE (DUF72 family)